MPAPTDPTIIGFLTEHAESTVMTVIGGLITALGAMHSHRLGQMEKRQEATDLRLNSSFVDQTEFSRFIETNDRQHDQVNTRLDKIDSRMERLQDTLLGRLDELNKAFWRGESRKAERAQEAEGRTIQREQDTENRTMQREQDRKE